MRAEMTEKLGLSEEQLKKIEAIDKQLEGQRGPEVWATRAQAMSEVLTPDQHQKMREMQGELRERFQERMKQRALERASVLPEGERELFLKKLEERMAQGPPRWGRGEGRGGDAPPPPPE